MITVIDHANIRPKGCTVQFFLIDILTGLRLENWRPPRFNMASPLASEVASRLLGGYVDSGTSNMYFPSKIEWGTGGVSLVGAPMDFNNPDLETPFSPTRVMTALNPPEYPGRGVVRFTSHLDSTVAGVSVGTSIQEVGLRTEPLTGYPDGILLARYQESSPINLSSTRVRIGVEWIYIYA